MKNYSLKKNFSYMAMAFYKPKQIIDIFLKETSFLYSAVPLIIFTIFYEILYILDYLFEVPGFIHIIAKVFQIPDVQYNLYQIFLFPVIHVADFFIFFGIIDYQNNNYYLKTENLDKYFIPKKNITVTKELLEKTNRGVRYTKSANFYLFRKK